MSKHPLAHVGSHDGQTASALLIGRCAVVGHAKRHSVVVGDPRRGPGLGHLCTRFTTCRADEPTERFAKCTGFQLETGHVEVQAALDLAGVTSQFLAGHRADVAPPAHEVGQLLVVGDRL